MDQRLGGMVGDVFNYVASDNDSNWKDVDGASWPTLYQPVEGGPNHAIVLVSMNEVRQGLNFFIFLAMLRDMLLHDLLKWAQQHAEHFDGELRVAAEWSLRPCAGGVVDLSTGVIIEKFQPEI
jgi:hypothetical protein